jgi:hypothetical protein
MKAVAGCFLAAAAGAISIREGMPPAAVGLVCLALGVIYLMNDVGRIAEKFELVPRAAPLEGALSEIEEDLENMTQELRAARSEIQNLTERVEFLVKHVSGTGVLVPASTVRPARTQLVTRRHPDGTWRRKGTVDGWDP